MQNFSFKRFTITEVKKTVGVLKNETYRDRDGKLDDETYKIGEKEVFSHYEILIERLSLNIEKTMERYAANGNDAVPALYRKTLETVTVAQKCQYDIVLGVPIVFAWGANDASGFTPYNAQKVWVRFHCGEPFNFGHEYDNSWTPVGELSELLINLNKKKYD